MIQDIISFLNIRISALDYFNQVKSLAFRIEKENKVYPAVYLNNNEYERINLDSFGSVCYWRLRSEPSFSEQESTSTIGNEYLTTIPLVLVGFMKKEQATNDSYFAENVINTLIGSLTTTSVALKQALKAKKLSISAVKYNQDGRILAKDEFDNIDYEPRYDSAFFSIDFDVKITTNQNCFDTLCGIAPPDFKCGSVKIYDGSGTLIETVECGDSYICDATGDPVTVHNSDDTYSTTVACGGDLELEDITFNIFVNGILNQSFSTPSMVDNTINITG